MKPKIKYTDEPLGKIKIIPDFLPSPHELAFREQSIKVTITLSKKSIDFFKTAALKHHTQYQRMIRQLLDTYVETHSRSLTNNSTRTARKRASSGHE
jgi:hypothetical protein